MGRVNTVLGSISPDELGTTLIHDHLACGFPGWECDALAMPYDRKAIAKTCIRALKKAKACGLMTMVDATPSDLGINIICATGLYTEAQGAASYLKFRSQMFDTTTEIYESFMKEITQGIGKTGVKAGIIKVATGYGCISPYEEVILKAAARAQKETRVPIVTHTEAGTMGPEQADLLLSEGVDPKRIVIGHICGSANLEYHISVLNKGCYIAFDRLGLNTLFPDTLRKACIIALIGIGYANRIMLSHDHIPHFLGRIPDLPDLAKALNPNWCYTHIFRNIIPALKEAGITDDRIDTLLVENPRRLFA